MAGAGGRRSGRARGITDVCVCWQLHPHTRLLSVAQPLKWSSGVSLLQQQTAAHTSVSVERLRVRRRISSRKRGGEGEEERQRRDLGLCSTQVISLCWTILH